MNGFSGGEIFMLCNNRLGTYEPYMLSQVAWGRHLLVCLKDGNRFNDSFILGVDQGKMGFAHIRAYVELVSDEEFTVTGWHKSAKDYYSID